MESRSCPDMHTPLGASGRNADVWGAENMGCREHGTEEWVEVVLLWGFVGWTLFFLCLFFFFYTCVLYTLKTKMGFVDSVNVTSDISL